MAKYYYHNFKSIDESIEKKNFPITKAAVQKRTVDINMLLNRVKLEKKIEATKKIMFIISSVSLVGLMGIFITVTK